MELNIGFITEDECNEALTIIEELKMYLDDCTTDKDEKPYKVVYYALCKLQQGIKNIVEEKEEEIANEPLKTDIRHTEL